MKLLPKLQTESTLLEGIVTALREKKGLPGSNAALEAKIKDIIISADEVAARTGVTATQLSAFVGLLANAATFSLVIGKDIVQSTGGSYKLLLLSAINYLANGRIYLLSEKANEQGALDMGCAPDILPGHRPVAYPEFRKKCENVWHTELSDKPGLNIFEMVDAAQKGTLKAAYVMGEKPFCNIPNSGRVEAASKNWIFWLLQDIFLTETAKVADVVLPALSWAEKDGTFTNMERRIQRVRKSVHREGMEDWKIIAEISKNMGYSMDYKGAEDVFHEAAKVSPLLRDLTYEDIENGDNIYPSEPKLCPTRRLSPQTVPAALSAWRRSPPGLRAWQLTCARTGGGRGGTPSCFPIFSLTAATRPSASSTTGISSKSARPRRTPTRTAS